ncbi:unnamed protein product [Moneuplotes crassus]|uniref:1-alkyl-2-acetylglycerophosphocholine esterase n=3 Tax=Euplotes crassus TaxID=5936 RepID=A0AAD1UJA1_EUPCR|nr:unnamed protein product [Moneuplotes crassus]
MFFLTIWEILLFLIFFIDLADDAIWHHTKFDIFQWDVARVWTVIAIYLSGVILGKVRLHCFFYLVFYLIIGSAYVFTETTFDQPIFYGKIFTLFMIALFSPTYDLEVTGKYGVGHRDILFEELLDSGDLSKEDKDFIKKSRRAPISVFYPIDKEIYLKQKGKSSKNISRTLGGGMTSRGLANGLGSLPNLLIKGFHLSILGFKYFTQERIEVVDKHPIHPDFGEEGRKKIKPIFWSHGLVFNRTSYSGICRELASQGYMVYSFDHSDKSCSWIKDGNSNIFYTEFDPKVAKCTAEEYRATQLRQRMCDVEYLLKIIEIKESKSFKNLDVENLIFCGHSYGGMTALEACHKFKDIFKCCVAIDPVFMSRYQQVAKNNEFVVPKTPFLLMSNEWFQSPKVPRRDTFDDWKTICKFYEDSLRSQDDPDGKKSKNEIIDGSYHLVQFDWALRDSVLLKTLGQIGKRCNVEAKQKETIRRMLDFIEKTLET